jgi:DNA-binding transcriptional LysR family regulator
MDLKQLRYFVAVADAGSFSAGAKRAFVKQPTLSAAISELEKELKIELFERGARGITVTAAGHRILDRARVILRESELLKAAGRSEPSRRPVRMGLLPTLPSILVASVLGRLRELDPNEVWTTEDASISQLRQRLATGRYDVIFTSLDKPERGHLQLPLAQDAQALAVAKACPPHGPVTPNVLHGQPLIVRTHCEHLQAGSRILDDWGVRPVIIARTESDDRALSMVAAGLGFCLMPDSFGHEAVGFLRPEGVHLPRTLGLEWIKGASEGRMDAIIRDRLA